jgi:hypothetical protein
MLSLKSLARDLGELCESKRRAYGDSVGKSAEILRILYPHGLAPDQYLDAITTARIIDKLSRKAQGADPHGESPYIDVAGHALVALAHSSVEVHDSCASANGSAAERQSQEPNDSAARNAAAPITPIASDASAKSSSAPSSRPSSSVSGSTAASARTATANASAAEDALLKGVERNRAGLCAQCERSLDTLPDALFLYQVVHLRKDGSGQPLKCCSLTCGVVLEGRAAK